MATDTAPAMVALQLRYPQQFSTLTPSAVRMATTIYAIRGTIRFEDGSNGWLRKDGQLSASLL